MRVCLSERTIKPNNWFILKHGALIESGVKKLNVLCIHTEISQNMVQ